jgi:hypothetical protein
VQRNHVVGAESEELGAQVVADEREPVKREFVVAWGHRLCGCCGSVNDLRGLF